MAVMQDSVLARRPLVGAGLLVVAAVGLLLVGSVVAFLPADAVTYLVLLLLTGVGAVWFIPRMVRREPTVSIQLLTTALVVKLAGSLARFLILEVVYKEHGDAYGYHTSGLQYFEQVRSLDFSWLHPPFVGTDFMHDITPMLYAVIGPSMLGGFLVFSILAFAGTWCFYRAHRLAFPDGDSRLYFLLLFFFPTMVFWPSSLGKDALVLFGTGLGTYGLARLMRGVPLRGLLMLAAGVATTFAVRPAVGAIFAFGVAAGFMIHPRPGASPFTRPITLLLLGPILVLGLLFTVRLASEFEGYEVTAEAATAYYAETSQNVATGGSSYEPSLPTSPASALQAAVTVLFRPFIYEGNSPLALAAGLEGLALLVLAVWRFRAVLRALKAWRGGMIVTAVLTSAGLIAALAAFSNFGLLVRQRAQVLTFLFMIIAAAPRRRQKVTGQTAPQPVPARSVQRSTTPGVAWIRSTASATRDT